MTKDNRMSLTVLALCGSLRRGSFNRALLNAAIELAPPSLRFDVADIGDLPLYNDDVRAAGLPEPVARLRAQAAACEAVLIVTPEYNYSIPGLLKNAIDWVSRPPTPPLDDKPLAIMTASPGALGGARAQYHLRQVAVFLNLHVLNKPEVVVMKAAEKFDGALKLTDEPTRALVRQQLEALATWTTRLRPPV